LAYCQYALNIAEALYCILNKLCAWKLNHKKASNSASSDMDWHVGTWN